MKITREDASSAGTWCSAAGSSCPLVPSPYSYLGPLGPPEQQPGLAPSCLDSAVSPGRDRKPEAWSECCGGRCVQPGAGPGVQPGVGSVQGTRPAGRGRCGITTCSAWNRACPIMGSAEAQTEIKCSSPVIVILALSVAHPGSGLRPPRDQGPRKLWGLPTLRGPLPSPCGRYVGCE